MRTTVFKLFLIGILLTSGCDNPSMTSLGGSSGSDYLSYLQTMNYVRVTYTGETLHHTFLKQGSLDGGNTSDLWLVRQHVFENRDSTHPLVWKDSQFSAQACFTLELVDPSFNIASGCSTQSLIRGVFHSSQKTVSDLLCQFQECEGCQDPNNYRAQNAYLKAQNLELESFSQDSIAFILKGWTGGSFAIGYNDDEVSYTTYLKQIQLTAFDTLGNNFSSVCRVVFYQ